MGVQNASFQIGTVNAYFCVEKTPKKKFQVNSNLKLIVSMFLSNVPPEAQHVTTRQCSLIAKLRLYNFIIKNI